MILKFNRSMGLEVPGLGEFERGDIVKAINENDAKKYLDSGYFDIIVEKKRKVKLEIKITSGIIKGKSKPFIDISKKKKSKKKGVDK